MVAFQYSFVTTVEDLIDADAIDRADRPIRLYRLLLDRARQLERIQLYVIGGFLAVALLIFILSSTWSDRLVVALFGAMLPIYQFVIAPRRARARIRAQYPPQQTVELEFARDGVSMDIANSGRVKKSWDHFTRATESKRGVLLYFGKARLLMPRRVFGTDDERREFLNYVRQFEPMDTPL